jgi:nitroimidazol reductase NimA-like FMN-containing flavoprotein (pyridoxamine 5'-phosphate oxidase superfamily)
LKNIRRKDKEISDKEEMLEILENAEYITIAMCSDDIPYLVTLSHGYDKEKHCIYFHCAKEGKKIDILTNNNVIWGQALLDKGYVQGGCSHLYATTQFKGRVTFIEDDLEKRHALIVMIRSLDSNPQEVIEKQLTENAVSRVIMGRIDIDYMSGKKAKDVIISL